MRGSHAAIATAEIELVQPQPELLQRLLPVARSIFSDTFAHKFEPEAFEAFCDEVYGPGGSICRDFVLPDVHWCVAICDGDSIGYAKLTPLRAPAPSAAPGAMELQQIYLLSHWHGRGVADRMMKWAVGAARQYGAMELYLTVFDDNQRAKRFYARHGFTEAGRCEFELGGRVHDDRVWRKALESSGVAVR